MNIKNEKGIALIMSIGIVAMLAIIGTTFAINMRLEQKASFNYMAGVKAKISAEGGIDAGIAAMKKYASDQSYDNPNNRWRYGYYSDEGLVTSASGTDVTCGSPNWIINALQNKIVKFITTTGERIYKISTNNTADTLTLTVTPAPSISSNSYYAFPIYLEGVIAATPADNSDTLTCRNINGEFPSWEASSLVDATTPLTIKFISGKASGKAFNITANTGNTLTSTVVGRDFGSTGEDVEINDEFIITLPSIPQVSLNRWQARVIDCARQIYVNDRSSNIGTILDYLGAAISSPLPTDIGTNASYGIVTKRPSGGYLTKEDVRYILRGNSATIAQGEERYNAIKDFITVTTYTDPTVTIECGGGATVTYTATSLTDTSKNWDSNWVGNYVMVYDATNGYQIGNITVNTATGLTVGSWNKSDGTATTPTDNSQYAIFAPRPRAPINVNTARKEVLIAVIQGLSDGTYTISSSDAGTIADQIISNRATTPFSTWVGTTNSAFEYFVDNNVAIGGLTNPTEKRRILKANFNPNARWIGWNRNSSQETYAYLAKSDLATSTTEISFNSGGYYEIESLGLLNDEVGNTLSQKKIKAITKVFDIWRQTSQADFEQRNTGEIEATHVARMSNVQTYPEFGGESTAALSAGTTSAANFDGQVMLDAKTISTAAEIYMFRAGYDQVSDSAHSNNTNDDRTANRSGNADPGTAGAIIASTTEQSAVIYNPQRNDLFPDGVYVSGETLIYDGTTTPGTNFDLSDDGTIEMWIKPNWDAATTTTDHYFFGVNTAVTQNVLYIMFRNSDDKIVLRITDNAGPPGVSHTVESPAVAWTANTWHHIACVWDNDVAVSGTNLMELYVDGSNASNTHTTDTVVTDNWTATTPTADLYIVSDSSGTTATMAEATIDEIRIYGAVYSTVLSHDRYYDKGESDFLNDPAYFTSITFPDTAFTTPVTWGTITWTGYTPSGYSPSDGIAFDIQTIEGGIERAFPALSTAPDFTSASSNNRINAITGVSSSTQLQYRARLAGTGTPLIDTPLLDDVTITYFTPVRFFSWQEVVE